MSLLAIWLQQEREKREHHHGPHEDVERHRKIAKTQHRNEEHFSKHHEGHPVPAVADDALRQKGSIQTKVLLFVVETHERECGRHAHR